MRATIILLAGQGKRFQDAGYAIPKPVILIDNVPMVVRAAQALPDSDRQVFLCRKEHIERYGIDKELLKHYPEAKIVPVEQLTEGQASTCLLAEPLVDANAILTIGACDNAVVWNKSVFENLINSEEVDAIIWTFTFRDNPQVVRNPHMYGWIKVDENDCAQKVSVKVPISEDPIDDHVIVGTFTFKKAAQFFTYAQDMIKQDRRINNEFYVDECMNLLIEAGLKVKVFKVNKFICWGTPQDLQVYEYWRDYFLR